MALLIQKVYVALSWMQDETRSDEKRAVRAEKDFDCLAARIADLEAESAALKEKLEKRTSALRRIGLWTYNYAPDGDAPTPERVERDFKSIARSGLDSAREAKGA